MLDLHNARFIGVASSWHAFLRTAGTVTVATSVGTVCYLPLHLLSTRDWLRWSIKITADGYLFYFLPAIAASPRGMTIRIALRPIFRYVRIGSGSEFFADNLVAIGSRGGALSSVAIAVPTILFRSFYWGITVLPAD